MIVKVVEDAGRETEDEVVVYCKSAAHPMVGQICKLLRDCDKSIQGMDEGKTCHLSPGDVLYFEVVDNKTFAYLENHVWQVKVSLESLEEEYEELGFFRVSKSCLINLKRVDHFTSTVNSRIVATMENKEKIMISRHYAKLLRAKMKTLKEKSHE